MSGKDSSFEEDFRPPRFLAEDYSEPPAYATSLSQNTFNSKSSGQMMAEERARLEAVAEANARYTPSRSRGFSSSPLKYSRNVQSADNTMLEENLSPSSMGNVISPRFLDGERQPFVSDYVAFGRGKDSFVSSKDRIPTAKRPDAASFSLYSDQSSYIQFDETGNKAARLEQQLAKKNEVIGQMAKEHASLTRDLQENQTRLSQLENYKTETQLQLQEAQRDVKSAESRYKSVLRELEDFRSKQQAKDEQYRKLDRQYSSMSLLQAKLDDLEAGKALCAREISDLKRDMSVKLKENESFRERIEAQEKQARELIAEKSEENHALKKERLRLLKEVDEAKRRETALERELKAGTADRERLKEQIHQLQDTVRTAEDRRDTEETIEVLRRENDALISELRANQRPQDLEKRVKELESALREEQQHVKYLTLMKDDHHLPRHSKHHPTRKRTNSGNSRVRTEDSAENRSKSPSFATQKRVLREMMDLFGVSGAGELVGVAKGVARKGKSWEAASEFIEKINGIVVQYSPPGTFIQAPSLKQVWKWVSRLIDEYMSLRKTHDSHVLLSDLLSELSAALSVSHYTELPAAVDALLTELAELKGRRSRNRGREDL